MKKKEEESGTNLKVTLSSQKKWKAKAWEKILLLASCHKSGFFHGPTCSSTPIMSWNKFGSSQNKNKPFLLSFLSSQISARKLGVALWEFQQYFDHNMYMGVNNSHKGHRYLHKLNKNDDHFGGESLDHHPTSAGSLRRHIAALLIRHHQSAESNKHALQPLSPASYGSSLEMAPYNRAATPDSSIELRGRIGESSYRFKTSTELLKVLNRIWTLEEQHASNISLVKSLKNELNHAHVRIKDLLRDQHANRFEIDELLKQVSEDNLGKKSKEQDHLDAALQSLRVELEDERKLRKRSESLHRKLAKELFEIKVALSTTVKDLEKERKSNDLLEQLCDEFALGIKEYARPVPAVTHKSDKDLDELILHVSESWLDERKQIKDTDKSSNVDKLRHDIEAFLTAKENRLRRFSLESIPEAASAPQCIGLEDSTISDSHCVEINKTELSTKEEQKELALTGEGTPTAISMLQKSDVYDSIKEGTSLRNKVYHEEGQGSNSKTADKLISELLMSEGGSFSRECESNPALRRNVSPVRRWKTSLTSPNPRVSESSTKILPVRDNTLKSKLQEPKSKGQRSRLKILKGLS